jgi:hypothetical protein
MTLQEYIDEINTSLIGWGVVRNPFPREYMKRLINRQRDKIAEETRSLECFSICDSTDGKAEYKLPGDWLEVLTVWYDGTLLDYMNDYNIDYYKTHELEGIPEYWSVYGSRNQPTAKLILVPTPNETGKEIKIKTIQLPRPLEPSEDTGQSIDCELPRDVQTLVIDACKQIIKADYGDRLAHVRRAEVERDIKKHTRTRSI